MKRSFHKKVFWVVSLAIFLVLGVSFAVEVFANHGLTTAQTQLMERAGFPGGAPPNINAIKARLPNDWEILQDERGLWYVADGNGEPLTSYFPTDEDAAVKVWVMINGDGDI